MRLRKTRIAVLFVIMAGLALSSYGYITKADNKSELIQYQKEVQVGETVWSICSEIATDKEDLGRLVWQTMKDNHIKDPNNVQPGMLLVVNVKRARGG